MKVPVSQTPEVVPLIAAQVTRGPAAPRPGRAGGRPGLRTLPRAARRAGLFGPRVLPGVVAFEPEPVERGVAHLLLVALDEGDVRGVGRLASLDLFRVGAPRLNLRERRLFQCVLLFSECVLALLLGERA